MRVRATLHRTSEGFRAECLDFPAVGEGADAAAAMRSLREALRDRAAPAESVAPPPSEGAPIEVEIDIVTPPDDAHERDPTGPGDPV